MGLSKKKRWLGSEVIFSNENNIKNNSDIKYLLEIDSSVAQRSIFEPLLFLIYVNTSTF